MAEERYELSVRDASYPSQLLETPDPPRVLYVRGSLSALALGVAIVGARRASPSGLSITSLLARAASQAGYPVISGAAVGCDQAAHRAAIDSRGCTVAVMGCGADVAYPRAAGPLLERILARGGAIVSEQAWGVQPRPWMFRRRNRIIAGLAAAVLVVESRIPSGTFSTADEALAAGRTVLAVPGCILSPYAQGPNSLIRQGAVPITSPEDLLDELGSLIGPPAGALAPLASDPEASAACQADGRIVDAVRALPATIDELCASLGLDPVEVARTLSGLEIEGVLERAVDGRYHVIAKGGSRGGRMNRC